MDNCNALHNAYYFVNETNLFSGCKVTASKLGGQYRKKGINKGQTAIVYI